MKENAAPQPYHIHRIKMHFVNAWLLHEGGRWLLIDTGKRQSARRLLAGMEKVGCSPSDIALTVITHAHYDHVGGMGALKMRCPDIPVAIHGEDEELLKTGGFEISDGLNALGRIKAFAGRHLAPRQFFAFDPVRANIVIKGERRIDDFGFAANIIPSPGHSPGSISVLTDAGDLFAGDLTITQPLPGIWRHMPLYGTSIREIKDSWRMLLDRGAKRIYPSHGSDFPASALERFV